MVTITVFTPAYNRGYILPQCYESLKRQTNKDFEWLIVDDGSSDNTGELVKEWIKNDNGFNIRYIYQENQGMHGAHNTAYENINTELNVCIDSDDYMPDNAIEKILDFWKNTEHDDHIAGILALDSYHDGSVIGGLLPVEEHQKGRMYDYYERYGVKGDKKFILRSDLTKGNPYPLFEGEKYVNLASKYSLLDKNYELLALNEVVCIVEYLEDGSSLNMFKQYLKNPKGFAYSRKLCMSLPNVSMSYRFRQAIHYVSSSIISRNKHFLKESPKKGLTVFAIPFGILLTVYIKKKAKEA